MAQNYRSPGQAVDYINNTGVEIVSGQVVFLGTVAGIALDSIPVNGIGSVMLHGVFELSKAAPLEIAQGDELFWNVGTEKVTKTVADILLGIASAPAASTDTLVQVLLRSNTNSLPQAAYVTAVATADGNDAATTQALANANKAKINAIIAALQGAGIMAAAE